MKLRDHLIVAASMLALTAGTSSSSALAAATTSRKVLTFTNQSSSATVTFCQSSVTTPAVGAVGCFDVSPKQVLSLCSPTFCPLDAFNMIASAASTPATVDAN